jgi:hypothetical protein
MDNNPEKTAQQEAGWKRANELHEKYRGSGLALTVLIVTLSAASLNALRPQGWLGFLFFLPIALSIIHQTCLYMGQRNEARSSWQWYIATMQAEHINSYPSGPADRLNAFQDTWAKSSSLALRQSVAARPLPFASTR